MAGIGERERDGHLGFNLGFEQVKCVLIRVYVPVTCRLEMQRLCADMSLGSSHIPLWWLPRLSEEEERMKRVEAPVAHSDFRCSKCCDSQQITYQWIFWFTYHIMQICVTFGLTPFRSHTRQVLDQLSHAVEEVMSFTGVERSAAEKALEENASVDL